MSTNHKGLPTALERELNISLEVVLLSIFGTFMLLLSMLLFQINVGGLTYSSDSTHGLFLLLIATQIITMGKTPIGDFRRSWSVTALGLILAITGMVACFIPNFLTELVRILVGYILFFGGVFLLCQLCFSKNKAQKWLRASNILRQLTMACAFTYILSIIIGIITISQNLVSNTQTAVIILLYGLSFLYLSWCINKTNTLYPVPESNKDVHKQNSFWLRESSISTSSAILIMSGSLLTIIGILLIPVNLGLIPFSPDGQLGVMLVIMAIQIMALGSTPLGDFKRSLVIVAIGMFFAIIGIFSCIAPRLITHHIQLTIGALNVLGGCLLLGKQLYARKVRSTQLIELPSCIKKLYITQTIVFTITITFGISMLIPNLLACTVVSLMLIICGLSIFRLIFIIEQMLIHKD